MSLLSKITKYVGGDLFKELKWVLFALTLAWTEIKTMLNKSR